MDISMNTTENLKLSLVEYINQDYQKIYNSEDKLLAYFKSSYEVYDKIWEKYPISELKVELMAWNQMKGVETIVEGTRVRGRNISNLTTLIYRLVGDTDGYRVQNQQAFRAHWSTLPQLNKCRSFSAAYKFLLLCEHLQPKTGYEPFAFYKRVDVVEGTGGSEDFSVKSLGVQYTMGTFNFSVGWNEYTEFSQTAEEALAVFMSHIRLKHNEAINNIGMI